MTVIEYNSAREINRWYVESGSAHDFVTSLMVFIEIVSR